MSALLCAPLGACTATPAGTGTGGLTTVSTTRLCPDTGTAREDAADLVACISTRASQYWTAQIGQAVDRLIVVAPDPDTVPEECRAFLEFGTAFFCPGDATVYITDTALDRDARVFGDQLPYAIAATVAHEFGHVVQHLVDQPGSNRGVTDAESRAFEQQADCLAGVWVRHATRLGQVNPIAFRAAFERQLRIIHSLPVPVALDGYDETVSHGTVEQRMVAFDSGVTDGSGRSCNLVGLDGG
ncbi:MAG: neutral zinc metallopeptidase [Actinomycetota bacterium]|nr:neutral zinc metallopeptidase [Actinomycetota bacterium]